MIIFNIAFREEFELANLIELVKLTAQICNPVNFHFEYTVGLEDGVYTEKTIYSEKTFHAFDAFEAFLDSTNFRFDTLHLIQKGDKHKVSFSQSRGRLGVYGRQKNSDVEDSIVKLAGESILYAYVHDELDLSLSRTNKYRSWERRLGEVPDYVRYYRNPRHEGGERDKYLIDLESVPTHHHLNVTEDKLWFGACARMYFSDVYYEYLPKEKWDEFTECTDNVVLKNGLRKIVLYNDFADFETVKNRDRQWEFRRQLNIDTVAHKLLGRNFAPKGMVKLIEADENWVSLKEGLDALQIASGQTFGKKRLRDIIAQLENGKVMIAKPGGPVVTLNSQEDLQSLINTYDPSIKISEYK